MVLKISPNVFKQLNEGILLFNRTATVVYPPQKEKCPNCYQNTMGGRSVNSYKPDGPVPFSRGVLCPVCGGEGFRSIEGKDSVELRIYYNKREFVNVGFDVDVPNNVIQTIGYMDDYVKLSRAAELLVDVGSHNQGRYKRLSEPYTQGFKQNPTQYIVLFWERV